MHDSEIRYELASICAQNYNVKGIAFAIDQVIFLL